MIPQIFELLNTWDEVIFKKTSFSMLRSFCLLNLIPIIDVFENKSVKVLYGFDSVFFWSRLIGID